MPARSAPARPNIILSETDADHLANIAEGAALAAPLASRLLLDEIARADVRPDAKVPAGVVAMGSTVTFVDELRGADRSVRLVYPAEADIEQDRISILSPVGVGLLGLRAGQSIQWPDRTGVERKLRVVRVEP